MATDERRAQKRGVSRRDFFRLTGGTAGVVAASAAISKGASSPAFAQGLDEAAQGANGGDSIHKRPWWVRTVDEPTTEIRWGEKERISEMTRTVRGPGLAGYVGEERVEQMGAISAENKLRRILDNEPGYGLRDWSLNAANGGTARVPMTFLPPREGIDTPESLGVPRWEGTPTENANMIRAALRHMGAATVGFVELDPDTTEKLIYSQDPDGKVLEFEDVDLGYETDDKRVIPLSARWVITYTVQMSEETMRLSPTPIGGQTTGICYARFTQIQAMLQRFLVGIGYEALGEASINALGISPAFGVLAGLGEMSRLNRMITPEFGPMVRVFKLVTDLPLEPTKPIDAGIMRFCETCKICAEECPSDSLSFEDEPFWETRGDWNEPGHKAWFEDSPSCMEYWRTGPGTNCGICFSVCPYAKKDETLVHGLVKATSATTGLFNGFFRSMDDAFGYGERDPAEWWSLDLPEYGIDTQRTATVQA
ncbi:MAG: reductive dehalogenase [Nitriliruptoraceae bacterium]